MELDVDPDEPLHPGEEDLDWTDSTVKGKLLNFFSAIF